METERAGSNGSALPVVGAQRAARRRAKGNPNPWARFAWVMAAVWLIFLYYPIVAILASTAGEAAQILAWVGLGGFVILYLLMFRLGLDQGVAGACGVRPRQYVLLGVLVAAILATVPAIGFDVAGFFPFLVSALAYQFRRWLYWSVSVITVAVVLTAMFTQPDGGSYVALLGILVILILVNFVSTWLIARSVDADRLSLELATSEERESVARDVHDLIGHSLTVVKLKAQLARRLVESDPERARAELEDIERITGEAIQGVRATVTGLRSEGLAAQLESARTALQAAGVRLEVRGETTALSPAQSLPAGWILREAVTNVLRHANASAVTVTLRPGELVVEDDGVGPGGKAGNGQRGMAERAAVSGGSCAVGASSLGGTKVEVTW
ncbi:MAG: sensor histidine kinase [Arthrobacter sp.]|nr:sensor histidine kinase [Arthrobacter sp.]